MEILLEIVVEILFEVVGEALVEIAWRGADGATRDAIGVPVASGRQRAIGLVVTTVVAAGIGYWRGVTVGELGWGWWFAVAVVVVTSTAAVMRRRRPAGPRPIRWAALTWWPAARLAWFAVANGAFAAAYAAGQAVG